MQIQKTDNITFKNGLYFSKASNVCFDKTANFVRQEGVKTSKDGYKYVEQVGLPKHIKEKFMNSKFLKDLSEKFDTFIWFTDIPKNAVINRSNHISLAKIMWADTTKKYAQAKEVIGTSEVSLQDAQKNMFDLLG